ncbi:hypothetical protein KM043_009846 [Ampulex compressa]|nr:hypothetical protein KM043_009846 [Ampulex compressa]
MEAGVISMSSLPAMAFERQGPRRPWKWVPGRFLRQTASSPEAELHLSGQNRPLLTRFSRRFIPRRRVGPYGSWIERGAHDGASAKCFGVKPRNDGASEDSARIEKMCLLIDYVGSGECVEAVNGNHRDDGD